MSRWLITLLSPALLCTPLLAEDEPAPKAPAAKTKAALKETVPLTKIKPGEKAEPAKIEPLTEKTIKERASYAIGVNFGGQLLDGIKQDGADLDMELLVKGFKDALTKPKAEYTDEELDMAIQAFDKALVAKNTVTSKATAEKNKKDGEAFLAKNKHEEGVETTASGLQYKVVKAGEGKTPQKTDTVRVHYHGMLPDGSAFDSSKQRGTAVEFPVTAVIKGWSEALLQMKVGDKWMLYVPSDLAYGSRRRSNVIGPNQVVLFEVELLDIVPLKDAEPKKVPVSEKVAAPKKTEARGEK